MNDNLAQAPTLKAHAKAIGEHAGQAGSQMFGHVKAGLHTASESLQHNIQNKSLLSSARSWGGRNPLKVLAGVGAVTMATVACVSNGTAQRSRATERQNESGITR